MTKYIQEDKAGLVKGHFKQSIKLCTLYLEFQNTEYSKIWSFFEHQHDFLFIFAPKNKINAQTIFHAPTLFYAQNYLEYSIKLPSRHGYKGHMKQK